MGRFGQGLGAHSLILLGVATLAVIGDRLTKAWVVATVEVGEQIPVIGDLLQVWHTENSGAAFGLLPGGGALFVMVGIATLAVVAWVHLTGRLPGPWAALLLGLVAGGTLGNLVDRLAGGTVTDFTGSRSGLYDDEILASNGGIHEQMLEILRAVGKRRGA